MSDPDPDCFPKVGSGFLHYGIRTRLFSRIGSGPLHLDLQPWLEDRSTGEQGLPTGSGFLTPDQDQIGSTKMAQRQLNMIKSLQRETERDRERQRDRERERETERQRERESERDN